MSKVVLVAESGADIPSEAAARYGIQIVPMHVSFGAVSRDDGNFPAEEVCRYYQQTKDLPKTSASTPEDFTRVFDRIHAAAPEAQILHLAYSAVTTCSFQSGLLAAEGRDYVTSVDTKMVSAGQYAVVLRIARLLAEHPEWGLSESKAAAEDLIPRCRMCFVPDTMEFLRAGGRVSNAAALCGKLLGIHPVIEILDGYLKATHKPRGDMKKIAPKLLEDYVERESLEREEIWLIRTPGLALDTQAAVEKTAQWMGIGTIHWVDTGGVITCHGGPGAFGVAGFARQM